MPDPFDPGLLDRLPPGPLKVAVLRAGRIGDYLCTTPALRALRAALPQAEITLITLPMLSELALRSPSIDRIARFPGYPGIAEQLFDPRRAARFFTNMQSQQLDLAIQFQGSGVNANPFILMLGARCSAGFIRPEDPPGLLDAALPLPEEGHEIQRMLALSTFLGAPVQGEETEFPLWPEDHDTARLFLQNVTPPWIGIHPAARDRTRRWPLERFATSAAELRRQTGGTLVVLGEDEEQPSARTVAELTGGPVLDLTGKTTLPVLGAVIARLALLLTNDTGPAHIAYALGTPTVTIFGSADPQRYAALQPGPFRTEIHPVLCRPCTHVECPIGYVCLENISVEQVVQTGLQLLQKETGALSAPVIRRQG